MEMANNIIKMKKTAFILLLAACTTLSAWAAKKKAVVASVLQLPEQEVAYNDGIAFLKMGNYEDAATKFSAAIAIDSTFANYDDITIRRLVDTIKVNKDDTITVSVKGGIEISVTLNESVSY